MNPVHTFPPCFSKICSSLYCYSPIYLSQGFQSGSFLQVFHPEFVYFASFHINLKHWLMSQGDSSESYRAFKIWKLVLELFEATEILDQCKLF